MSGHAGPQELSASQHKNAAHVAPPFHIYVRTFNGLGLGYLKGNYHNYQKPSRLARHWESFERRAALTGNPAHFLEKNVLLIIYEERVEFMGHSLRYGEQTSL